MEFGDFRYFGYYGIEELVGCRIFWTLRYVLWARGGGRGSAEGVFGCLFKDLRLVVLCCKDSGFSEVFWGFEVWRMRKACV